MRTLKAIKYFLLFMIALICAHASYPKNIFERDSLIKFHGYIYDTISNTPKKLPVGAKIVLERLPYGSEIGIISSDDSTGHFEYLLSFDHDYKISIKSEGHSDINDVVKTKEWASNGQLQKNYYMTPELKEDQVIRLQNLIFEQGKAIISSDSYAELNRLANTMKQRSEMVIQLEGHTDWRGAHKSNMKLSEKRVEAVKKYLIAQGIDNKRIKTKAFGGTRPITRKASVEASSINRRVEVRILKLN